MAAIRRGWFNRKSRALDRLVCGNPSAIGVSVGELGTALPRQQRAHFCLEEIVGGAPYGATTIAGGKGERQPSRLELDGARHQGELIAKIAAK